MSKTATHLSSQEWVSCARQGSNPRIKAKVGVMCTRAHARMLTSLKQRLMQQAKTGYAECCEGLGIMTKSEVQLVFAILEPCSVVAL